MYSNHNIGNKISGFLLALTAFLFYSCSSNNLFEKNLVINDSEWHYHDSKIFNVDINDTTSHFDFYLNIRNTTDYKFSNLFVFMHTFFPDSTMAKDTIEVILANENGEWIGSGWGKKRFTSTLLGKNIQFTIPGTYSFEIKQAMRTDVLYDISDVGIKIEKNKF